ncbi:MAG: FAD-binding protein, partial [Oscillospiraceae bacterium]|nr:FAD-binding protein [Oscillospiraceae bacterium]
FKTPMVQLISEDGRVKGAIAKNDDGDYIAFLARDGVVLCTGDIGGNEEMCEDLAPWVAKCAQNLCWHNGSSDGDGHKAAVWLGAQLDDGPFPMIMHPQANRHNSACFLFVTKNGKRFMNEDSYLQGRSIGINQTGEKFVWSIFDSDWPTKLPATLPYGGGLYWGQTYAYGKGQWSEKMEQDVFDWGLKTGVTVMADTPEELAEKMGVDKEGFVNTLNSYNEMCRNGRDTEFGKRRELLMPLDKPPYIARKIGPAVLAVVGGLKVDTSMRVIGEDNAPIPGLYALGNTAGGRYAVDYPMVIPGNSIGFALTFGYLLGRQFAGK